MNTLNRLQFRHHSEQFETRDAAIEYIKGVASNSIANAESGLAAANKDYGFSLLAEPTILTYNNEEDANNPHVMLAIGSTTNDSGQYYNNRFCIIDIDFTEEEIKELDEKIDAVISSLTVIAMDSNTIAMHAEKTDVGTIISGDVTLSPYEILNNERKENKLLATDNGLFIFASLSYDENNDKLIFQINEDKSEIALDSDYLVSGEYSKEEESLVLNMKKGGEVKISLEDLIDEWAVLGDASDTPIVLTREEHYYGDDDPHHHVEPWQDVLKADVRIASNTMVPNNILEKTDDGRYLFVDGKASNISYYNNGEKTNVKAVLDELTQIGLSSDSDNIIVQRVDGFFASAKLSYDTLTNKLTFKTSNQEPTVIQLNSVEIFTSIYYDSVREELVLQYVDAKHQVQTIRIPIGEMIEEWEPFNDGHSVSIVRTRSIGGKDKVSADVKIRSHEGTDNILEDYNHELYVRGTSDNIKHGSNSTVMHEINELHATDESQEAHLTKIDNTIGSGFSDDVHDNITAKFENEVSRATSEEGRIEGKLDDEITRSTAKDNELDAKINAETARAISAETALDEKIDQVNKDRYIEVGNTNSVAMTMTPNQGSGNTITSEVRISSKSGNIISIDANPNSGIYASIDLNYDSNTDTLTLSRNGLDDKTIQLSGDSSIERIYYDAHTEELVIEYRVDGGQIKEVRVPLGDLIHEVDVDSGHTEGAIQLGIVHSHDSGGTPTPDMIFADIIVSQAADNIIEIRDNSLYVSNSAITTNAANIATLSGKVTTAESNIVDLGNDLSAENARALAAEHQLGDDILAERNRATSAETALQTAINDEVTRATNAEGRLADSAVTLNAKIDAENSRAISAETAEYNRAYAAENALQVALNSEISSARTEEQRIESKLDGEITRATSAETSLQADIASERTRATNAESSITHSLSDEANARTSADAALDGRVSAIENGVGRLNVSDTKTVNLVLDTASTYNLSANVKIANGIDNMLITEEDHGVYATVDLTYDASENKLIFTKSDRLSSGHSVSKEYTLAGGSIIDHMEYNDGILTIYYYTAGSSTLQHVDVDLNELVNDWVVVNPTQNAVELVKSSGSTSDELSADVKIVPLEDMPSNILKKTSMGQLFVSGDSSNIKHGSGTVSSYIEDIIGEIADIQQGEIGSEGKITALSGTVSNLLSGTGLEQTSGLYPQYPSGCFISAATSLMSADVILDQNLCEVKEALNNIVVGSETYSTHVYVDVIDNNKRMKADVRVSHGSPIPSGYQMSDEELMIKNYSGATIEDGVTEFSDTNVLRMINVERNEHGDPIRPESLCNGIYLSNVWDCGLYTPNGQGTPRSKYKTDETASGEDIDYGNYNRVS